MSYVYFAQFGVGSNPIKIGCSSHVPIRMRWLAAALKMEGRLLALIPGGFTREQYLHRRFADLRVSIDDPVMDSLRFVTANEWFWLGDALSAFIAEIERGENPLSAAELEETAENPIFEASKERTRNYIARRHRDQKARFISGRFGSRQALAEAIGVAKSTVDAWHRDSWSIPAEYHRQILAAARRLGVDVTPFDFADG